MGAYNQTLTFVRGEDGQAVLTGADNTDPTGWALSFQLATHPTATPVLTITSVTVGGAGPYTLTIPYTRAQSSALSGDRYSFDLWRTDSGSAVRLAAGWADVVPPVYPPAS